MGREWWGGGGWKRRGDSSHTAKQRGELIAVGSKHV